MFRTCHLARMLVCVCMCVSRSVGWSVRKAYCGKTADWIRMPIGMVSVVGRGIGVLYEGGNRRREGAALRVNFGRPIVTNGDFVA